MNFSLPLLVFSSTLKNSPNISVLIPSSQFPWNGWDSSLLPTSCYHTKQECNLSLLPPHSSSSLLGCGKYILTTLSLLKFDTKLFNLAEKNTAALKITWSKQNYIFFYNVVIFFSKEGIFRILWSWLFLSLMFSLIYYSLYFTFLLLSYKRPRNCEIFLLLKHVRYEKENLPLAPFICLFACQNTKWFLFCKYYMATLSLWE